MSLKSFISANVSKRLFSKAQLAKMRQKAEAQRQKAGLPHEVYYFHQADDPYSHLTVQVLADLVLRYHIKLTPMLVEQPPDWAAPERDLLKSWSRRDAETLAAKSALKFTDQGQPEAAPVAAAESALVAALEKGSFVEEAAAISATLWSGGKSNSTGASKEAVAAAKAAGSAKREEWKHYLGATFYYGGEWYWGIDRLHYLEERLKDLGVHKKDGRASAIYTPPVCPQAQKMAVPKGEIDYFLSFRSPYTYIVLELLKSLADAYGATINYRFVLPMVMRALPVPAMKGRYITFDTAREARRLGVPFGIIADPVGKPVERNYSLLPWAIEQGRAYEFCLSFMRAVWAEGMDAGEEKNICKIVERAGLDWGIAKNILDNEDWRPIAEANREEMIGHGLWGVPSFRLGSVSTWGQDRLWVIEEALQTGRWKS